MGAGRQPVIRPWLDTLFMDHAFLRTVWRNWGVVEEGRVYRSNHPLPGGLRRLVKRHGIRSIVNLRGEPHETSASGLTHAEATRLGLTQFHLRLAAGGVPDRERIERLIATLPTLPQPMLIHCKSGADRTGLVAAIWLLMQGREPSVALRELSLRYGHIKASRTGILDMFLADYARAWPTPFLEWLRHDYDPESLRQRFTSRRWADALTQKVLRRE